MSEETIDKAIQVFNLSPKIKNSITKNFHLLGSKDYDNLLNFEIMREYNLDNDISKHLINTYGIFSKNLLNEGNKYIFIQNLKY
jgi:glycerol-3-phosphate dehydrogenase